MLFPLSVPSSIHFLIPLLIPVLIRFTNSFIDSFLDSFIDSFITGSPDASKRNHRAFHDAPKLSPTGNILRSPTRAPQCLAGLAAACSSHVAHWARPERRSVAIVPARAPRVKQTRPSLTGVGLEEGCKHGDRLDFGLPPRGGRDSPSLRSRSSRLRAD